MSTQHDNKKTRQLLKTYFETGDRPTEEEFEELIDSLLNQRDDDIYAFHENGERRIGVGLKNPEAKLSVSGYGLDENSKGILRVDAKEGQEGTNLRFGVVEDKRSWIQAHGSVPLHINRVGNDTVLNELSGNVGIGEGNPDNKLVVQGQTDTGLKLPSGAQLGFVLVSDQNGNASWQPGTAIKNGLWNVTTGNDIANGNTGKVGVGINNPSEKLHVQGTVQIEGNVKGNANGGAFVITSDQTNGGGYMEMLSSNMSHENQGGINWIARGNGKNNGFNFLHFNPTAPYGQWKRSLRIDGNGDQILDDTTIYFRSGANGTPDYNHGLGWFGGGKPFAGRQFDGVVLFGHNGGALGSANKQNNEQRIAIRWDKYERVGINDMGDPVNWPHRFQIWGKGNVPMLLETRHNDAIHFYDTDYDGDPQKLKGKTPFTLLDKTGARGFRFYSGGNENRERFRIEHNGDILVNQRKPIVVERVYLGELNNGKGLGKYKSDYGAALVVGYETTETTLEGVGLDRTRFEIDIRTYVGASNEWHIKADIKSEVNSNHSHERWTVTIMYIRKEMVTWTTGL